MLRIATIEERAEAGTEDSVPGFCWFYCDIRDPEGNGFVMNWAVGLPFLMGSRDFDRVSKISSLNIVSYRRGQQDKYLLQEWPTEGVRFDRATGNARFGPSSLSVRDEQGLTVLSANLDLELPDGETLRGEVQVTGPRFVLDEEQVVSQAAAHLWCPETVHAHGYVRLMNGTERWQVQGSAYVDSNLSSIPLHEQGISRWDWGRVSFSRYTLVFYWSRSEEGKEEAFSVLLAVGADGKGERLKAELVSRKNKTSRYLVTTARRLTFRTERGEFTVDLVRSVDGSPFYERYLAEAVAPDGERGSGFAEVVLPLRVDRSWMRPFVRMRTHSLVRQNSFWLPLFSGGARPPTVRLLKSLSRRARHV